MYTNDSLHGVCFPTVYKTSGNNKQKEDNSLLHITTSHDKHFKAGLGEVVPEIVLMKITICISSIT